MNIHLEKKNKKIIIFYSSIGYGHISAAQAIKKEIHKHNPYAVIVLKDIRDFMNPLWRKIDEKLYWLVAGNCPELFDVLFQEIQMRGNSVPSLALLPNDYPDEKVFEFIQSQQPDVILSTHYGAAQVLGNLREKGKLKNIKIGWLHTDFFQGYFPRISKRIDQTFLAHRKLYKMWLSAGVPSEKIITTGMPVYVPEYEHKDQKTILDKYNLAEDIPIVLITSGKEGVGNYAALVKDIVAHYKGALQIVAVCGKNKKQQFLLKTLKKNLPDNVKLKIFSLLTHDDLLSLMNIADVLITKAGGLTPVEAFSIGVPTILLNILSGHERENASFFARLGVAKLASNTNQAAELLQTFLFNPAEKEAICRAQKKFKENFKIEHIVRFALNDNFISCSLPGDFGAENGKPVINVNDALSQLDANSPAEVELLLSYATSHSPQRIIWENPFGHIAIRIDKTVYSANYIANPSVDSNFLQHLSLADYLYGVKPPSPSQIHTNTYGMAYGRETIGLRVAGVPAQNLTAMIAEIYRIENDFKQGIIKWDKTKFNCADVVDRILQAGGYGESNIYEKFKLPSMPLDSFEKAKKIFESDASLKTDLVAYHMVPGANADYNYCRFPLSLKQPIRSLTRTLSNSKDFLEMSISKHLVVYYGDPRVYFENLRSDFENKNAHFYNSHHYVYYKALANDLKKFFKFKKAPPKINFWKMSFLKQ
ncbi:MULTISPECIES: MGDG synthase family glycosyltransferase [unclassified Lebetimonas]|uniref:MGDG synthase family glycosyltransferase n=1 Tax=unclassified Lebetimonas TaxID=2648158 RepID=UPI0004673AFF|nr:MULTISPECIES: glycosyltransferase [unclassified Lebetimonas]